MDNLERALRMEVATKQLEIDKLKRIIREKEDIINANTTRQRNNPPREKAKGTSKSSISNK
jgi:hypothetical protein